MGKNYNESVSNEVKDVTFEYSPPDGGWGYIIILSLTVILNVTVVLVTPFTIIYGEFLKKLGDETSCTTLSNSIFMSACCFTGLMANYMLAKMSYRKVGLIGAVTYFIGASGIIFANSLFQFILFFGVIQGLGFGLMMPAIFTAFDAYFDKKKTFMMNLSQIFLVIVTMLSPIVIQTIKENYGYRGTVAILAALSLNAFAFMLTFHPLKWHMVKRKVLNGQEKSLLNNVQKDFSTHGGSLRSLDNQYSKEKVAALNEITKINSVYHGASLPEDVLREQLAPLEYAPKDLRSFVLKSKLSLISIGDRTASVNSVNGVGIVKSKIEASIKKESLWQSIKNDMDLSLLKDPIYLNVAFGLSFAYTADMMFISIIPILLENIGYNPSERTIFLTAYFGSDLLSRIILAAYSALFAVNNKNIFLCGSTLSVILRTGFVIDGGYWYTFIVGCMLGFLRAFVQSPMALVICEEYPDNFSSAFSLSNVVNGIVFLVCGPVVTLMKNITGSDNMVVHVLSVMYLMCIIPWSIQIIYRKMKGNTK